MILEYLANCDRAGIEDMIERLINMLDDLDGDADFEPSLAGWHGGTDDREDDPAEKEEECGWRPSVQCPTSVQTLRAWEIST